MRTLGRSGIEVSALGVGCWAIGGPLWAGDQPLGWGDVVDDESIRAIHRALDLGVTFFDTASNYGAGHSERVLGRALAGRRDQVVVASKFGNVFDEATRQAQGQDDSVAFMRSSLEGTLRRLGTDYLDLFQFHINGAPLERALDLVEPLEELVRQGKIRAYGWSTDDPARAEAFARAGEHCAAIQVNLNVLDDNAAMIGVCERLGLASVIRGPLAMGLLTGKYHDGRRIGGDDVRGRSPEWLRYFRDGVAAPGFRARVDAVREALTVGGRTLAQGSIAWLWARSPGTVPIPGCRTAAQVEENAGALALGPLSPDEFAEVEKLLR